MIRLPIGDIIRESFRLAWKHKYLWLFGLFAGGGGGGASFGRKELTAGDIEAASQWLLAALAMVILVGGLILVIVLILHVISKSALIYNVYQIDTNGTPGLSAGWDFGLKRFWPMLGLTLLEIVVLVAFVVFVTGVEVFLFVLSRPLGFFSLVFAIPSVLVGLVAIVLTWLYADRFVTLETRGVINSIGEGWTLLRSQWQPTVIVAMVKFAIQIAVLVALLGIGGMLALPAIALWMASKPLAILYGITVGVPFIFMTTAYLGTFDSAVWTRVFLQLRAPAYATAGTVTPPATPETPSEPTAPSPPVFE